MNHDQPAIERRTHLRVMARGAVLLREGGREIHGRGMVVDETCLEVCCQLGSTLEVGASVEIEMSLDGVAGTVFVARGHVTHVRAAGHSHVIELEALPESLATLLDRSQ